MPGCSGRKLDGMRKCGDEGYPKTKGVGLLVKKLPNTVVETNIDRGHMHGLMTPVGLALGVLRRENAPIAFEF